MEGVYPAEGQKGGDDMGQLVGERFHHVDVLFQKTIHEREDRRSDCKPNYPRIVTRGMCWQPVAEALGMSCQRMPGLRKKKQSQQDKKDPDEEVGGFG